MVLYLQLSFIRSFNKYSTNVLPATIRPGTGESFNAAFVRHSIIITLNNTENETV